MVSERMTQAVAMPHVSKPPTMLQPLSATNRVMILGLSSKTVSHIQMSVLARWTIQPRLMGVPGVANVSIWGQRDRQLQVQVDPKRLAGKERFAAAGFGNDRQLALGFVVVVRRSIDARNRRLHRHRESAARHPPYLADRFRQGACRKFRSRTPKTSASPTWRTWLKIISR